MTKHKNASDPEGTHPHLRHSRQSTTTILSQGSKRFEEKPVEHNPAPSPVSNALDDASSRVAVGGKAEAMRAKLQAEPKVRVLVPLASGEKAGVTQSVILNGYSLYIRKGEYVDVPQSVADVLEAKMKHKIAVDNHPLRADAEGGVKMDRYGQ
jgi:hypothetical protein